MAWDNTEKTGLGVAIAAHVLLLGLLSLSLNPVPRSFDNPPMAVEIIAEKAPVSTAPQPSSEAPAAQRGEQGVDAPDPVPAPKPEPKPAPPPPPPPLPLPKAPAPRPAPASRVTPPRTTPARPAPAARTTPPRTAPPRATPPAARQPDSSERRRPDRTTPPAATRPATPARPNARTAGDPLGDIANSVSRTPNPNARAANPPAQQTAAQVRADIRVSINQEVRAPWNACRVTGIDVDQLRTTVVFALQQDGRLARIVSVSTTGTNDSNRPQVQRFEECARRAIQIAAPFTLPADYYSYWQTYTLDFEKR